MTVVDGEFDLRKLTFAICGWPNFLRRLQWFAIDRTLDANGQETVLDLGAGQMRYSSLIARSESVFVIAADLDFQAIDIDFAKRKGVVPLRADGQCLPLADRSVDRILMSSFLHMIPDPLKVLRECRRILKDGGHVVLSVPNHYQFIPKFMKSRAWPTISRLFGLPLTIAELVLNLNERFHVHGPQGYYSLDELTVLLTTAEFEIIEHEYSPGRFGSFLWELGVLGFMRIGNMSFHLMFLAYPIAWAVEFFKGPSAGSEHIIKVGPIRG